MREKIKRTKVEITGLGSRVDNKANGGEDLADCEFLSVGPNFSIAINSQSGLVGWGTDVSGILDFAQAGLINKKFKNVSAGNDHAVGIFLKDEGEDESFDGCEFGTGEALRQYSQSGASGTINPKNETSFFKYIFNYNSPYSGFDFSRSYTGNWQSPIWVPGSNFEPYFDFDKRVTLTGIFDAGLVIKKYPSEEKIFEQKYSEASFFSGDFDLKKNESFSLEVYPKPRLLLPNQMNPWSCTSVAKIFKKSEEKYSVTGWGSNYSGKLNFLNHRKNFTSPKFALASNDFSLILFENGKVTGCGENNSGQLSGLDILNNIVDIAAGFEHSLFLDKSGEIYSRGSNSFGQCNFPNIDNIFQIAAGGYNSAVLYKKNLNSEEYSIFATGRSENFNFTEINSVKNPAYVNVGPSAIVVVLKNGKILRFGDRTCAEDVQNLKNCIYGFDGGNYSQFIVSNGVKDTKFLEIGADLSFNGRLDQVIENLSIDTAIRKKIEDVNGIRYIKKDSSIFNINFQSGSFSNSFSDSFLKISGASLLEKKITGSSFISKYLDDPIIQVNNGVDSYKIDNWESDISLLDENYKNEIFNSGYIDPLSFSGRDPFLRVKRNLSDNKTKNYNLQISDKSNENLFIDINEKPNRFVFSWKNLPINNPPSVDLISTDRAFITYDNRTGTTSKNVFGYALEFEKGVFSTYTKFSEDDAYKDYFYNPILNSQAEVFNGWYSFTSSFKSICVQKDGCEKTELKEKEMCIDGLTGAYSFPGSGTGKTDLPPTGSQYDSWAKKIQSGFMKTTPTSSTSNSYLYEQGISTGGLQTDLIFSGSSGIILFGDFFSGDSLIFKPYNLEQVGGYSGLYESIYFEPPPYDEIKGFDLKFKVDFNTPEELVQALNTKFSNYNTGIEKNDHIWYWGMGCGTGLGETGIFEKITNPVAEAFNVSPGAFFTGATDETLKYWSGRVIGFRANYFHQSGMLFEIQKSPRKIEASVKNLDGYKFVLPKKISLYASKDGNAWTLLDVRSGIEWSGLEPTERSVDISYFNSDLTMSKEFSHLSGYNEKSIYDELLTKTGTKIESGSFSVSETVIDPHYQERDLFSMTRTYLKQSKPFCEPEIIEETLPVFYAGSGVTCKIKEEDEGDGDGEKEKEKEEEKNEGNEPLIIQSIRTGWLIDYKKFSMTQADLFKLNLNYLKIEFENFESPIELNSLKPVSFFHVNKINFFSMEQTSPELKTNLNCWDGGTYEITPSGQVPVNISGSFTADVRSQDSGVRNFKAALISGKIIDYSSGDYIRLNRLSGKLLSDTGYAIYSGPLYATGKFCTGISDWFYNKDTKIVDTKKEFCSIFNSGSGNFSGSYLRIKPEIANRDLAVGRFLNPAYEVNFETGIFYTGYFYGKNYVSGYTGYIKIPYSITGYSTSGTIDFNKNFNGSSSGSEIRAIANPIAYYQSSGFFKVNEHLLSIGDSLSLNDNSIFYNPDSGNAVAPTYFNNFNSLSEILTGDLYSGLFNCKFDIDNQEKTILIKAIPLGSSGNSIEFNFESVSGGISGLNGFSYGGSLLTGGETVYQKISGTGNYSYNLGLSGYKTTGFYYSNAGSGSITGLVNTYQGERTFTGAWALATGRSTILQNLKLTSSLNNIYSGHYSNTGDANIYPDKINLAVGYRDSFSIGGKDAAKLTVEDENYVYMDQDNKLITGSGMSIIIKNY